MRWYYKLPLRLHSLFRKDKAELDLGDELQFHLQNQIEEFVAHGMNPQEARRAALQSLGGVEQVKEECREMRHTNLIENFLQDVRFGFRMLRRSPGFSVPTPSVRHRIVRTLNPGLRRSMRKFLATR